MITMCVIVLQEIVGGIAMNERECLMKEIMAVDFALTDLALYLNTHPNDFKIICVYNNCVKKFKELIKEYQEKFGPIYREFSTSPSQWQWSENPWPWDSKYNFNMGGNI